MIIKLGETLLIKIEEEEIGSINGKVKMTVTLRLLFDQKLKE